MATAQTAEVLDDEVRWAPKRRRPARRAGAGPLGVELRFLWGDRLVGEYFLRPDVERSFLVGAGRGVDFVVGDQELGPAAFELLRSGKQGVTLRFRDQMRGGLQRGAGAEVLTLAQARRQGLVAAAADDDDGDGSAIELGADDFAWVEVGGLVAEVSFQPTPRPVSVPLAESIDYTAMNVLLVTFFLGVLFVISAASRSAEGEAMDDELTASQARLAKLLVRPPEPRRRSIAESAERPEEAPAAKRRDAEGSMGRPRAPDRTARAAPRGDPSQKAQARRLMKDLFGVGTPVSAVFGAQGLGGELTQAMGQVLGAAPADAAGLHGLGLRGPGPGGGGPGEAIGIAGLDTRGRRDGYGVGVGDLEPKRRTDIVGDWTQATVEGALDRGLIRKVIHAHRGQIRYCYELGLGKRPQLEGKLSVRFVIGPEGAVSASSVAQSTVNDAELEACVIGRVRTWRFPTPKGAGVVVVTYPFVFKESGR